MALSREDVASALLSRAASHTSADVLFPAATRVSSICQLPNPALARTYVKGSLVHACVIAGSPAADPAVLAAFGSDSRVAVRESLLRNPSTPQETIEKLSHWALARDNKAVIAAVITRLTPEQAVSDAEANIGTLRRALYSGNFFASGELARKADDDASLARRLLALDLAGVTSEIIRRIAEGNSTALTLSEAIDAAGGASAACAAIERAYSAATVLTCSLAAAAADARFTSDANADSIRFVTVEEGSLERLGLGNPSMFETAVLLGVSEEWILGRLDFEAAIEQTMGGGRLLELLNVIASLPLHAREFSGEFERRFVERLVSSPASVGLGQASAVSAKFLERAQHALPAGLMLAWLRSQSEWFTLAWIAQPSGVNSPQPGEVQALLASPGEALTAHAIPRVARGRAPATASTAVQRLVNDFMVLALSRVAFSTGRSGETRPGVFEALDPVIGSRLSTHEAAAIAMPILERTFGSQALAWETLLTLATDWQGSLTDLIGATLDLSGCTDLSKAAAEPVAGVPQDQSSTNCVQMAFA